MTIWAAARRTLMTWRQPTAHCHVIKKNFISTHELTQVSHVGPDFLTPSLRGCCPSQVATLSVRRVSPCQVSRIQVQPLIMPWSSGGWRSTHLNAHDNRSSKRVPAGVQFGSGLLQKTHSTKLRVSVHGLLIQIFCSQVRTQMSFQPTRVVLTSPLIIMALQPFRRVCDMSDTSSTSSHGNGSACRCIQLDFEARTVDSIT